DDVKVPAGKPVALVFVRKTDKTCAKEVRLKVGDKTIEQKLPIDTPVEIDVTFPKAGTLVYACAMDMVHGTITVQK
ncbi:MAG TPA: cupredoxin domain-containing protein, partial [Kofleriaceae bacterium]|nr:cupredoxin domain-containing protein [Kofleriaceae bacterium]